eukprot:PhM_4_TR14712/c0_g2_i2/m.63111
MRQRSTDAELATKPKPDTVMDVARPAPPKDVPSLVASDSSSGLTGRPSDTTDVAVVRGPYLMSRGTATHAPSSRGSRGATQSRVRSSTYVASADSDGAPKTHTGRLDSVGRKPSPRTVMSVPPRLSAMGGCTLPTPNRFTVETRNSCDRAMLIVASRVAALMDAERTISSSRPTMPKRSVPRGSSDSRSNLYMTLGVTPTAKATSPTPRVASSASADTTTGRGVRTSIDDTVRCGASGKNDTRPMASSRSTTHTTRCRRLGSVKTLHFSTDVHREPDSASEGQSAKATSRTVTFEMLLDGNETNCGVEDVADESLAAPNRTTTSGPSPVLLSSCTSPRTADQLPPTRSWQGVDTDAESVVLHTVPFSKAVSVTSPADVMTHPTASG